MDRLRRLAVAAAAALLLGAATPTLLPAPGGEAWEPLHFRSISRHTVYTPLEDARGVRAEADCSASALVLPVRDVDLARTPLLRWRWGVDRGLEIEDERSRGGDDFAARVYVMFRFEAEEASLLERARRRLGSALFGAEMPGTALNFVWASRVPEGATWKNPYDAHARMLALASGAAEGDDWRSESVDVGAAYRAAFGQAPPPLLALGIMTDADDTCQRAAARYADFRFTAAEAS